MKTDNGNEYQSFWEIYIDVLIKFALSVVVMTLFFSCFFLFIKGLWYIYQEKGLLSLIGFSITIAFFLGIPFCLAKKIHREKRPKKTFNMV